LREVRGIATLHDVLSAVADTTLPLPTENLVDLTNIASPVRALTLESFEVGSIRAHDVERRLDVCWRSKGENRRWIDIISRNYLRTPWVVEVRGEGQYGRRGVWPSQSFPPTIYLPVDDPEIDGLGSADAVEIDRQFFLLPESPLTIALRGFFAEEGTSINRNTAYALGLLAETLTAYDGQRDLTSLVERHIVPRTGQLQGSESIDFSVIAAVIESAAWSVYRAHTWNREA
jgi:hypothetical protein